MKKMLAIAILFCASYAFGQQLSPEVISSAGDYQEAGGYSISWTLGEPVTETFTGVDNILTQGFQQTNLVVISVSETPSLDWSVFPNPTADILNIQFPAPTSKNLTISLFDVNGRLVSQEVLTAGTSSHKIDFSGFAAARYQISIGEKKRKPLAVYTIIKSQ